LKNRFIVKDDRIKLSYWWIYQILREYLVSSTTSEQVRKGKRGKKTKISTRTETTLVLNLLPLECFPTDLISRFSLEHKCPSCEVSFTSLPSSIKGDTRGVDLIVRQITSYLYR